MKLQPLQQVQTRGSSRFCLHYGMKNRQWHRFPPDTRGFFYYYTPHESDSPNVSTPPQSPPGELRFRQTPTDDPAGFAEGHDLLHCDGLPWSVPLERVATSAASGVIRDMLLRDKLISEELLERVRARIGHSFIPSRRLVWGPGSSFGVDLHRRSWCLMTATSTDAEDARRTYYLFRNVFWKPDGGPYLNGKLLCRFERYSVPPRVRLAEPRVAIRVLKIITPLESLAPLPPERAMDVPVEGGLLTQRGRPYTILATRSKALRFFVDAETAGASDSALPRTSQEH
ncbi:hypothetical protein DENSPDRAFT_840154 [Dentipellis sp. KUC8613]|nr:hypothetical protein DENSPDRAFT_840154 [Dentipellis sp. KUC8613]